MSNNSMIIAGVMSGTSADGINVALVRINRDSARPSSNEDESSPQSKIQPHQSIQLIGHSEYRYPPRVRKAVLAAMNARQVSVADLARLNTLLGSLYASAVAATQKRFRVQVDLVGCHGQTLYHQATAKSYLGRKVKTTWQTGEPAIIAAEVGAPVVSDFRPADMVAGGKGAPLVPYLDYLWFRDKKIGRIVQNIGGIANLTAIAPGVSPNRIFAFDTGPGNMVIDAVMQRLYRRSYDPDGRIGASGTVLDSVIEETLRSPFFRARPPKTAGREEFGREFVARFVGSCGRASKADIVATATALTAQSIGFAVRRFVIPSVKRKNVFRELILSGGGALNSTLVGMLAEELAPMGIQLRFSNEFGLPSEAKEAVAFAVLAYETWRQRPSNVPSATGARRPAILGKISYA